MRLRHGHQAANQAGGHEERWVAKARGRRQTGRMPRNLDYLPASKRAEQAFVVELLTTGFDAPPHLIT